MSFVTAFQAHFGAVWSDVAWPTYQNANDTTSTEGRPQAAWGTHLPGGLWCSGRLNISQNVEKNTRKVAKKKSENLVKKKQRIAPKNIRELPQKMRENMFFFSKTVAVVFKIRILGTGAGRLD